VVRHRVPALRRARRDRGGGHVPCRTDISVSAVECVDDEACAALAESRIDAALVSGPLGDGPLVGHRLIEDPLVLLVQADAPLARRGNVPSASATSCLTVTPSITCAVRSAPHTLACWWESPPWRCSHWRSRLSAVTDRGVTVEAVSAISARSALDADRPGTLARSFAGVRFPDWSSAHGWTAVGARRDHVDGRATDTVYYRHTHHRIGYTVLSGPSLGLPWEGRGVVSNGVDIQLYRDGERTVAVFERAGRTCVLAGVVHREDTLVKLASWGGDGTLTF
jgi:hypothetical protein